MHRFFFNFDKKLFDMILFYIPTRMVRTNNLSFRYFEFILLYFFIRINILNVQNIIHI